MPCQNQEYNAWGHRLLFLIYGLQKSASSFVLQLATDIATAAGYDQAAIREALPEGSIHGLIPTNKQFIKPLLGHPIIVAKTHNSPTPFVRDKIREGRIRVMGTRRDPLDCVISLLDHGQRLRDTGKRQGGNFWRIEGTREAIDRIASYLPKLRAWEDIPEVEWIEYDDSANRPFDVAERIRAHMGVSVDTAAIVNSYLSGSKPIGNFNKGVGGRGRRMSASDIDYAKSAFNAAISGRPVVLADQNSGTK